jgi:hypothetical protein
MKVSMLRKDCNCNRATFPHMATSLDHALRTAALIAGLSVLQVFSRVGMNIPSRTYYDDT